MKLHTDRADIQRSGVGTETEFKIKTTAKAFDILSTGIYTDNIMAIVRELSCNAYDAHVAAGRKDVPFEIHLPNDLEPFFSVKDFGTGLSDSQVMTLYTTYFDSTKTDSNDFIGALGLGSKSPFSYTKAFEVISRHEGMRRVYSVFINEDGVPTIARLGDAIPTDEHNGLEVKMTVVRDDFYKFASKASSALRWFETKPTVIGSVHFEFEHPPKTDMQGDGWYIYKGSTYSKQMHAVQGNVEYRVDIKQIEGVSDVVKAFLRQVNVIAFFNIGELEVAASREEIRYDKRTVAALERKIEAIHKAVTKSLESEANKYKDSMWRTIIELNKLSGSMFNDASSLRAFVKGSEHPVLKRYADSKGHVEIKRPSGHQIFHYTWGRYRRNLKREQFNGMVDPSDYTAVVINDVKTGSISRLTEWMKGSKFDRAVLITPHKTPQKAVEVDVNGVKQTTLVPMTSKEVETELADIISGLGNPTVFVVSRDMIAVRKSASKRMKSIFRYEDYNSNAYRPDTVVWKRVDEIDMERGGLYFCLERGTAIKHKDKKINWSARSVHTHLTQIADAINTHFGLTDSDQYDVTENVIGVGALDIKKFQAHDKWINMFDLLEQIVPTYQAAIAAVEQWEITPNVHGLKSIIKDRAFHTRVNRLDPSSTFRQVVEAMNATHDAAAKARTPALAVIREWDVRYGLNVTGSVDVTGAISENALEKYPMLAFVDQIRFSGATAATRMDLLFDYIKLIDRS
jgi:hypothetical protein